MDEAPRNPNALHEPEDAPEAAADSASVRGMRTGRRAEGDGGVRADNPVEETKSYRVFGKSLTPAQVFSAVGLACFLALLVVATVALWPVITSIFSEDGREQLIAWVNDAGALGVFVLLGLEIVQVVVAVIPGEVVQMIAGMLYGPWLGALIVLCGCVISTTLVYQLVHRLGQPFVEALVPTRYLESFENFEKSGKLSTMVFVLFLIPGLPKDIFTYLVPLTNMRLREYLVLATVGRTPGVLMSTFAASGLVNGNIVQSVAVFAVLAAIAVVAYVFRDRIMGRRS